VSTHHGNSVDTGSHLLLALTQNYGSSVTSLCNLVEYPVAQSSGSPEAGVTVGSVGTCWERAARSRSC
jgi:hypothetical protein